jgi:hypothetical protein
MVQWTSSFTIGVTQMISNSEIPPPSSGYSISFPNQPLARISRFEQERNLLERFMLPLHHTRFFLDLPP